MTRAHRLGHFLGRLAVLGLVVLCLAMSWGVATVILEVMR